MLAETGSRYILADCKKIKSTKMAQHLNILKAHITPLSVFLQSERFSFYKNKCPGIEMG